MIHTIKNIVVYASIVGLPTMSSMAETIKETTSSSHVASTTVKHDNSGHNVRDQNNNITTPFDQSNDQRHIDITAMIRKSLVGSDNLSINAQNVKIITTKDDQIVLRGTVASLDEKSKIETIAMNNAKGYRVHNEIQVQN